MGAARPRIESDVDETDGGRPAGQRLRTCLVTRETKPAAELIRFVVGPDGRVTPDLRARLPGRGVWATPRADILARAVATRAFARAFRREVTVPSDLVAEVDTLLLERARESLALANKAGEVTTGAAKVDIALERGVSALLHASDAAEDGASKLDRKLRAIEGDAAESFRVFDGMQMDLALGRANVVHAALGRGPAAHACLERIRTLVRFRSLGRAGAMGWDVNGSGTRPASGTDRE